MPVVRTSTGIRPSVWFTAVLDVDLREVLVARDVERDVDRRHAAIGARRRHVGHAFDAVDGLFERGGHRGFDFLRVGAGVERGHRDLRQGQGPDCATGMVGIATAPARIRTSRPMPGSAGG